VIVDRAHDVVGNLPGLLERAARQQDGELVATETTDGVRITDRILDERGDLSQHAVARDVAAFVVDGLEAVEVEVAQHVPRATPRCFQRFLEPALELAAVHQPGEGVVARLVRHHPREATQVAHVTQCDDGAVDAAIGVAHGRHRQFDRTLAVAGGETSMPRHDSAFRWSGTAARSLAACGHLFHQLMTSRSVRRGFRGRFAHQLFAGELMGRCGRRRRSDTLASESGPPTRCRCASCPPRSARRHLTPVTITAGGHPASCARS
jgi:hypothetical protein